MFKNNMFYFSKNQSKDGPSSAPQDDNNPVDNNDKETIQVDRNNAVCRVK